MESMESQLYRNNSYAYYDTTLAPDEDRRGEFTIFLGMLLFMLSVITIIGNIATILAFRDNRQLRHKTSNLLILSLSCSDLIIGATGLPFAAITFSLGNWPLGKPFCIFGAFFSVLGVSGGMYTLMAINIDRWLLVSREYSTYLRIQSLRNIKLQIAGAWTAAVLMSSCELLIWVAGGAKETESLIDYTMECRSPVRTDLRFAFVTGFLLFLVPFFVMLVCSLRFVVLLRRRLRRPKPKPKLSSSSISNASSRSAELKSESSAPNTPLEKSPPVGLDTEPVTPGSGPVSAGWKSTAASNSLQNSPASHATLASVGKKRSCFTFREKSRSKTHSKKMKNRYMKPAIRLAILMSVFAFCSLPYPFFVLIADTKCKDCDAMVVARNHLSNLLLANSALNPFLYAIMHRKIRQFHSRKFKSIFCRHKRNVSI